MALLSVLSPGDELLMVDSAYAPTRIFCDKELKRLGITTRYYDPVATPAEIDAMVSDKTRAIFMESPGSLTCEVQDVPGICAMAQARGLATLLDNTWATSLFFPAIDKGVDLSVIACTKYISGHSDVMMGAITAAPSHWERLQRTIRGYGQYVSPDDAYLVARGLRTLGVRLRAHEANALKVAAWLKVHAQVATVLHPAFQECQGHEHWKRDYKGSSGLFSFALKGADRSARDAVIDRLKLFAIGQSWGGYESLATTADTDGIRTVSKRDFGGPLIRLHIGLEDPDDLIEDLAQALSA
jgi:cystathionine beta-lyase